MKKSLFFYIFLVLLFTSCSNLHFRDTTSVSIYLPVLENTTDTGNVSRVIDFPQGYDDSVYYYEVDLIQHGKIKYTKTAKGGQTITFAGIHAGEYEIECKASVKKSFDFFVFAQKLENILIVSGKQNVVNLDLDLVPIINKNLKSYFFSFNDNTGIGFSVIKDFLPGEYNVDYKVDWYIDGKPYYYTCNDTNVIAPSLPDTEMNETSFYLYVSGNGWNPGIPFGPHSLYAKITNLKKNSFICTNVVDVYFKENSSSIEPVSIDVKFKGSPNNTFPASEDLELSDFYGSVTFKVSCSGKPDSYLTMNYDSFPDNGELEFTDSYPGMGILNMSGSSDSGLQTYHFTITGYDEVKTDVTLKRI